MSRKAAIGLSALLFVGLSIGIASSISLIGGLGIEMVEEKLLSIIPLLIALPALNSMVGDYATLIAAHAGDPTERTRSKTDIVRAIVPAVMVNIVIIIGLSLMLGVARDYALESSFVIKFIGFVVFSVISIIAIMFLMTIMLDKLLLRHRLNPDDLLIPIVTTISDIFMLGMIALAAQFLF